MRNLFRKRYKYRREAYNQLFVWDDRDKAQNARAEILRATLKAAFGIIVHAVFEPATGKYYRAPKFKFYAQAK